MKGLVVVVEDNLFLRPKIEGSLATAGYDSLFIADAGRVEDALAGGPLALLVNLGSSRLPGLDIVRRARELSGGDLLILGYGPHVDEVIFAKGREAGCDKVLPNGLVAKDAGGVVARHVVGA